MSDRTIFETDMPIQRVVACVCTCQRPLMLDACLLSLVKQRVSPNISMTILVIDNEEEPYNHDAVKRVQPYSPFHVRYVHQPKRGIASARNAGLETAQRFGADWIAFIDDDEIANQYWIDRLMSPLYWDTAVLMGVVKQEQLIDPPFWNVAKRSDRRKEGENCKSGTTGNVRISMGLVQAGFRFNEELGLMGGEDNEFFAETLKAGWTMKRTLKAVVYEAAHPERLTYFGQMYRAYWCAASDVRRTAIAKGWKNTYTRKTHTIPFNILFGLAELVVSPVFYFAGLTSFKRRALAGGKKIAKGAGRFAAFIGKLPSPYANIQGS